MSDHPKLKRGILWWTPGVMAEGEHAHFPVEALHVDADLRCWVDPAAKAIVGFLYDPTSKTGQKGFRLTRIAGGFRLGFLGDGSRIPIAGTPPPASSLPWLPVLEVDYPEGTKD